MYNLELSIYLNHIHCRKQKKLKSWNPTNHIHMSCTIPTSSNRCARTYTHTLLDLHSNSDMCPGAQQTNLKVMSFPPSLFCPHLSNDKLFPLNLFSISTLLLLDNYNSLNLLSCPQTPQLILCTACKVIFLKHTHTHKLIIWFLYWNFFKNHISPMGSIRYNRRPFVICCHFQPF